MLYFLAAVADRRGEFKRGEVLRDFATGLGKDAFGDANQDVADLISKLEFQEYVLLNKRIYRPSSLKRAIQSELWKQPETEEGEEWLDEMGMTMLSIAMSYGDLVIDLDPTSLPPILPASVSTSPLLASSPPPFTIYRPLSTSSSPPNPLSTLPPTRVMSEEEFLLEFGDFTNGFESTSSLSSFFLSIPSRLSLACTACKTSIVACGACFFKRKK